ncbi:kinesin-like protein KIN-14K [Diospyros lotus]|uniref:kinesin-like protein KIN-14K n=1 Tax=Diospyros lotus TaxID=55363 RepID=UPI00225839BC|nr:kinesin-like protein KIN-14K [Diospyros lotus]
MNFTMDRQAKGYGRSNSSTVPTGSNVFEPATIINGETEAKQRTALIEWLNSILPDLSLPINASGDELRALLSDGTVLCRILNRLRPGSVLECGISDHPSESGSDNLKRFLASMDEMKLPRFQVSDLQKGSMKPVFECLLILRAQFMPNFVGRNTPNSGSPNSHGRDSSMGPKHPVQNPGSSDGSLEQKPAQAHSSSLSREERRKAAWKFASDSMFRRALCSPVMAEPSAALLHHVGNKFQEVFQLKHGRYSDLSAGRISEMMKPNSLDNAPTQSLLSVVNGILDESTERKNGELPHRVACLLRKVVQEIERRISNQAEHFRTQSNIFKSREEKYQSRIKVLEALATGSNEETQVVMNQLQQIKAETIKIEEKRKFEEEDVRRLAKEKNQIHQEILSLKQELEIARKSKEESCLQLTKDAEGAQGKLVEKLTEVDQLLSESRNRVKELEAYSELKNQRWNKKEHIYQIFTEFQLGALRELRFASQSIKQEISRTQESYSDEFQNLGIKLKALADASKNYYSVLAENRKLHNEVQELKGNIRVYCRIRPFLPGEEGRESIVEHIGENGELGVMNPSKQGKDGRRSFKFNEVYGPATTQAEVYSDIQPLIRSVLDGYNVCIFAYGQTGSGKTYTMSGPDGASEEDWGVNYRALNDLFNISQNRNHAFKYELGVQMVEVYNEQVRDLLSSDGSQKKLEILLNSRPNGIAVPDATMQPVISTSDVVELMEIGLRNRAKGATALNERSSRSHSIVTIHTHGTDTKSGASLRGSLHLIDLAGSERLDRIDVTGDRLKESQHINKSLSALGDVIFALSQKSAHVPYRNSKLTQVLQSSLGGHAKTLMFVQLNPELDSYSETMSTLKFAERVSGVELGAARSSKDGRDAKGLMEQVASLKDTITKKDEEIERLQLLKDLKNVYQGVNADQKRSTRG